MAGQTIDTVNRADDDATGNLLTDNLNSYTWDPNWGNMLTVNTGSTIDREWTSMPGGSEQRLTMDQAHDAFENALNYLPECQ
jgi:hypothetical protein